MIKSYKDLEVWQKSMVLAKEIYQITKQLPREEIYGLTSQMRRAVVSIPSNIAEERQRQHQKEFRQFLYHSLGSLAELETQLVIAKEVYQIQIPAETVEQLDVLGKKLGAFVKKFNIPATNS